MKQLLIDHTPFHIAKLSLSEAKMAPGGRMRVKGKLQESEVKNGNGRVYPKEVLQREVEKYMEGPIKSNTAMGELDHPESTIVNLNNVSHNILKIWWNGDDLLGAVQILETPSGKILKELFKAGITLGISSRGLGSVKELRSEGTVEVQEDFELICWDFVSNPSTHGAFMRPTSMNESVDKMNTANKYNKVNSLITSILCEDGKCRII